MDNLSKIMSEPVNIELTESVKKIKNNIMIMSFIAIFMVWNKISINPKSSFFGLTFDGLDNNKIYLGLLLVLFFSLIHFIWCSFDSFTEFRIRVTAFPVKDRASPYQDYHLVYPPDDIRNSTLYYWWVKNSHQHIDVLSEVEQLKACLSTMSDKSSNCDPSNANLILMHELRNNVLSRLANVDQYCSHIKTLTDNEVLTKSLSKFDNCFWLFVKSQNVRWFLFDCIVPIFLALVAISMILSELI